MILRISLPVFYSRGDERRLFIAFKELVAIRGVKGVGADLLLDVRVAALTKEAMRELLALLWRYGIDLAPLHVFANKSKFAWLKDETAYWYDAMFKADVLSSHTPHSP